VDGRRNVYALTAAVALSVGMAGPIHGQATANSPAVPVERGPAGPIYQGRDPLRDMSPQERQKFQQNIERWRKLSPEEQRDLRILEAVRQVRIKREAEAALRDSGLQLEGDRRQQYEQRYLQERRRVEQSLRPELQERRQRELAPVVEQLRREFAPPPVPQPAPPKPANGRGAGPAPQPK